MRPAPSYSRFESIPDVLARRVAGHAGQVFLTLDGRQLTYAELDAGSAAISVFLDDWGIRFGDRVGFMLDNSAELLFSWFGIVRLGAIEVPLNTALKGKHLEYIVGNCGMRLLIISAS